SSGLATLMSFADDGAKTTQTPDQSFQATKNSADPRFAVAANYESEFAYSTPLGIQYLSKRTKTADLLDISNPFSFTELRDNTTINFSRNFSSIYTSANRTWTNTSAEGRVSQITLDEKEKPVQFQLGQLLPTSLTYDERG